MADDARTPPHSSGDSRCAADSPRDKQAHTQRTQTQRSETDEFGVPRRMQHSWSATFGLFGIDAALVFMFAALGNRSHDTGLTPPDIASTAWPFLVGLAASWWLALSFLRPHGIWPYGLFTVAGTVAFGMLLRGTVTDGGVQTSFVLVASGSLAVLMLGRRLLTGWLTRRRRGHAPPSLSP